METSIFLAKLMGLFSIVMGLSMFARRKMLMSIFHEISTNRALSYILGVLIFIIGLLIVLSHNVWGRGFPIVITIIGWGVLLEGAVFLFMSSESLERYLASLDSKKVYYFIALAYLFLGLYLIFSGFYN